MTNKMVARVFLRARITELWRFKAHKVENNDKEDNLSFFKPGLWQTGFLRCRKEWYHFQQKLIVTPNKNAEKMFLVLLPGNFLPSNNTDIQINNHTETL